MHDGHEFRCGEQHEPNLEETTVLLDYMLHHNEHHSAELLAIAGRLEALGKKDEAAQLRFAGEEFDKGNLRVAATLAALKE